ncbi:hypothetical protein RND71_036227 [Anisodus tanguticus]|uniref:NB-ARC domain-containing protein n=1 Tax=Anisodus tanguticus TaxID=243964 RepID=A0AAE1R6C4_9SOLA|nr:hypothetical protein RND71_036227 [Anisodus tanguticus]
MEARKIIEIGILSEEEAWILFRQNAGNSVDDTSRRHIAKDVANECKGLPLAIITVAGALKCKSKTSWEAALIQLQRSAPRNIPEERSCKVKRKRLQECADRVAARWISEMGGASLQNSLMDKYNRIMDLEATKSTPLGDWIRHMLRKSEVVRSK